MEKIYEFFARRRWLLWTLFGISFAIFTAIGVQCHLEEDIFKLLPQQHTEDTPDLAFSNLRLKDKILLQVCSADTAEAVDAETLAMAMDRFVELVQEQDSDTRYITSTLVDIDPLMLLDAGTWLMEHGAAYTDFTEEEMDSLTEVEHIRQQVAMYNELLETSMGQNLYDIIAYDPCGISMKQLRDPNLALKFGNGEESSSAFQYNHLFAGQGRTCIGFMAPAFGPNDSHTATFLNRYMERAKETVEAEFPGTEVLFHGTVVLAGYNSLRIRQDLLITLGIALAIILLLLGICLRQPRYLVLLVVPILYGGLLSLMAIRLARGWMSLMAFGLGVIVLGVALSYCLHVVIHYIYLGDVRRTIREQTKPVTLGALTTIGAFAGLLFTKSSLLQDFGAFALLTIAGTTFVSLFVMPHAFPKKSEPNQRAFRFLERINAYSIDRNIPICVITLLWVAVCICFSGRYTFDSNLRNIGYISADTQKAMDSWSVMQNGGRQQQYYASFDADLNTALNRLPEMERVADSLYEAGVITKPMHMSIAMPSLEKQQERIDHWEAYFTPARREQVWRNIERACALEDIDPELFLPFREQMEVLPEPELLAEAELLPEEVLANFLEVAEDRYLVYFPLKFRTEDTRKVNDCMAACEGCMVLDPYYYSTSMVELIRSDFNRIMLISSILVLILLLLTYRNIFVALIAFLPMTLSWYTVLGAMALFNQPFNLINIVVSSFIFGIGVDYSIFIMDGLQRGEGSRTMVYHKTAITMSAFILVFCMFSLLFAQHPAVHSIAFASLVGMITTQLLCYTMEPNLYRLYKYCRNKMHTRSRKAEYERREQDQ